MVGKYLAGPLIGALIGYCTNYIAVKMLFYPKKEIRVFGHKLPFTPGAIPKGKSRLAKAIGEVVGKTLLTKEDIEASLSSDAVRSQISDGILSEMSGTIKNMVVKTADLSEEQYAAGKEKLSELLGNEITSALAQMDLSGIIADKGGDVVKQKIKGTMLEMFLTDDLIRSVTGPLGTELKTMISDQGTEFVQPVIREKLDEMEQKTSLELMNQMSVTEEDIRNTVSSTFTKLVSRYAGKIVDEIDISGIVENKINEMNIDDLEDLVMKVMKKELNMIVNLGALIGFLLGLLNIFI